MLGYKPKCQVMVPSVDYLGHVIEARGLHPLPDKVVAVQQAPTPSNVTELKSYLGLLTYGKFLPKLSMLLAPLYKLLGKNVLNFHGVGLLSKINFYESQRICSHPLSYLCTLTLNSL